VKCDVDKLSYKKIFWIFLIASIIGAFYEELLFIIKSFINYGIFSWEPRRGVFWGPISPIYGMGAVLMCIVLVNEKETMVRTFFKASILGGLTEYVINFLQEFFLGTTSWDYTGKFLNINGRTTIVFMFFWGVLGICFVKIIYPSLSKIIDIVSNKFGTNITVIIFIILSIDIFISWGALIRQSLRHNSIEPITIVGRVYDKYFDDNYILEKFPNMVRNK